jgi:hypothetical protein
MEGNPHQGYLQQEDVSYDDLMNNDAWSVTGDQFTFAPSAAQSSFQQYTASQPSFDQYQQPAYTGPYSASPYVSQYQQHAVPTDVFGSPPYNVDASQHQQNPTLYHGSDSPFSFSAQEGTTISPHSLQYHALPSQPILRGASNASFQQPANSYTQMAAQEQPAAFFDHAQNAPAQQATPLQYHALPSSSIDPALQPAMKRPREGEGVSKAPQQTQPEPTQSQPRATKPNGGNQGPGFEHAPFILWAGPPVQSSVRG